MPETTEEISTCPACGSTAQVRLVTVVSPLHWIVGRDPYISVFFCLECRDYHDEEGESDG